MIARKGRTFWIDENLPPALAQWVATQADATASHFRALGLVETPDRDIFTQARDAEAVIVSKDEDFARLVSDMGAPPQVVWVRTGNARTTDLIKLFERHFTSLQSLLDDGNPLVALES